MVGSSMAASLSLPTVLLRLAADSSALDCCRFLLVDLDLAGRTDSAAVWLAACWSWALIVGGGDGGMVVVQKQEMISNTTSLNMGIGFRGFSENINRGVQTSLDPSIIHSNSTSIKRMTTNVVICHLVAMRLLLTWHHRESKKKNLQKITKGQNNNGYRLVTTWNQQKIIL